MGEAELDLSLYKEGEYNQFHLKLEKCVDNNAYIEVGLRATAAEAEKKKKSKDANGGAKAGEEVNQD